MKILIVDDYNEWRRKVRQLLRGLPESQSQVIFEASDGLEAVQKAEELKPNLVVIDISLPKLDGIKAARQICQHSPTSKIIFITQNNSLDIAQAALDTGAQGYVYKANAQSELLPAVETVLRGKQFVQSQRKEL